METLPMNGNNSCFAPQLSPNYLRLYVLLQLVNRRMGAAMPMQPTVNIQRNYFLAVAVISM
jgi:hypothetical protein